MKSKGLTAGQPKVLDYLKDHDGAGQKEIAAGCHIEAATLTSVLNRMEEKGMIRRQMKNGNRRSLYVFLTDYGRELAGFVEQEFARAEQAVFSGFLRRSRRSAGPCWDGSMETLRRKLRSETMEKAKRYLIFLIGLFINSMGVSLITKASLGTSPISSIPYVLSLNFPVTLGEFTVLFSVLLIAAQLLILRKNFRLEHWLQLPISAAFGFLLT